MKLGIVGSEAAKFTPVTEQAARSAILALFDEYTPTHVVSGKCHLGGIDIWAVEEATKRGIEVIEYPPKKHEWSGGYKDRNVQIAKCSDVVVCITIKCLPEGYKGMRFKSCYHCNTSDHVKSGGCWTTKYARALGKPTITLVV